MIKIFLPFLFILAASTIAGCKKEGESPAAELSLAEKGKKVYMANCIACHNVNPRLDGGLGPANWGASKELLYSKIVKGTYPEGYTPKRKSNAMVALPHLEKDIEALHAFLNEP